MSPTLRGKRLRGIACRSATRRLRHRHPRSPTLFWRRRGPQTGAVRQQPRSGAGEIVIMTGPSGSGKTTLLTSIGTLADGPRGTSTSWQELRGGTARTADRRSPRTRLIFQHHNLFASSAPWKTSGWAGNCSSQGPANRPPRNRHVARWGGNRCHYKPGIFPAGKSSASAIARALRRSATGAGRRTNRLRRDRQSGREVVTLFQEFGRSSNSTNC